MSLPVREDGILLYIFALIGRTNRVCVEICAGDGVECNTANLILNHGWWGHLFDGGAENVKRGRAYFRNSRETFLAPPSFTLCWITAANVNEMMGNVGVAGEIDLLSLDIDGMDYWVWEAIDCVRPRVVVCETQNIIGPEHALTIPYDPAFRISVPDYHSASLSAMTKLARRKGYRLIGTHRYGFNAFFVLDGVGEDLLPTVDPSDCLKDPYTRDAQAERWPKVSSMPWVTV